MNGGDSTDKVKKTVKKYWLKLEGLTNCFWPPNHKVVHLSTRIDEAEARLVQVRASRPVKEPAPRNEEEWEPMIGLQQEPKGVGGMSLAALLAAERQLRKPGSAKKLIKKPLKKWTK